MPYAQRDTEDQLCKDGAGFNSRPDRKRFVKDTSYMAVGNRDPRDVSTILRVLFFREV